MCPGALTTAIFHRQPEGAVLAKREILLMGSLDGPHVGVVILVDRQPRILHAIGSVDSPGRVIHSSLPEIRQVWSRLQLWRHNEDEKRRNPISAPEPFSPQLASPSWRKPPRAWRSSTTRCRKSASTTSRRCRCIPRLRRWLRRRGGLLFAPSTENTFRGRSGKLLSARVMPLFFRSFRMAARA